MITSFSDVLVRMDASNPNHAPLHRALSRLNGKHDGQRLYSVREWFEANTGKRVDTAQWQPVGGFWGPLQRTVNTDRKTYVTLDGSRRDYKDMRLIYADDTTMWAELYYGKDRASGWVVYTLTDV